LIDIEEEIKNTKVRLCLDCGKCTVVCPVSQFDPDFNPRSIIQKRLGIDSKNADNPAIWQCLNCGMCVEFCNYNVKLTDFIRVLRYEAVDSGYRVECSHSGMLQAVMHMMSSKEIKQERLNWLPEDIKVDHDSETIFFVGCAPYFDVIFEDIGVKSTDGAIGALRLLNMAKIPFNLLENERCCGRDLLLQGDRDGFQKLAESNIEEFDKNGVKRIITYCPECYDCLKNEYPKLTGKNNIEIVSIYELIDPELLKTIGKDEQKEKMTYHDPCTLGRGFRIFDEPRRLIESIGNTELVEMENNRESSLCCGANPWAYCNSVNKQIQVKRLEQAEATGAELMVTACPKCEIHLKCAQKSNDNIDKTLKIRDLASLVAASLSGGK
jgi:heterodisulfide reductase subunit D